MNSLIRSRRGVVAIEFALIAPFMVLLLGGVVEASNLVLAYSKAGAAAQTIADLASQSACVNGEAIEDLYAAADMVLHPFDPAGASYSIVGVKYDASSGAAAIDWTYTQGSSAPDAAGILAKVGSLGSKGDGVIVASVVYPYASALGAMIYDSITISEEAVFRPRGGGAVTDAGAGDCS